MINWVNNTEVTTLTAGLGVNVTGTASTGPTVALASLFVPCYAATTGILTNIAYNNGTAGVGATITYTGVVFNPFGTDGTSPPINSRILVKDQTSGSRVQNGVYVLTTVGATSGSIPYVLTRSTDYNLATQILAPNVISVLNGSTLAGTTWIESDAVNTIGVDFINFTQSTNTNTTYTPSTITFDGYGRMTNAVARGMAVLISGTSWVVPTGVTSAKVTLIGGGGGGGGGGSSAARLGGGGGAGATTISYITGLTGAAITYAIGSGGTAGTSSLAGGNGGNTTFGAISAAGGTGGAIGTTGLGGAGGVGVGGISGGSTISLSGAAGGYGGSASTSITGYGGNSSLGGGGESIQGGGTTPVAGGNAATNTGAGGAGGVGSANTPSNGGTGAPGIIIIEY